MNGWNVNALAVREYARNVIKTDNNDESYTKLSKTNSN